MQIGDTLNVCYTTKRGVLLTYPAQVTDFASSNKVQLIWRLAWCEKETWKQMWFYKFSGMPVIRYSSDDNWWIER